ncbi:MAG: response regulator [Nitrospirota bacterium]|nr:response regulator [Nitrospirota bacterium]
MTLLNKILIVDDSQLIHNMYKLIMNRYHGCKILDAMNGLEALDMLSRESDFDLILLDINMPVMNGIQFMEKLHGENLYRHIPVIVISTEGREDDTLRALKLGAVGYVVKPFKANLLHELIEKIVGKQQKISPFAEIDRRKETASK